MLPFFSFLTCEAIDAIKDVYDQLQMILLTVTVGDSFLQFAIVPPKRNNSIYRRCY